jgi:hypothetical protein
MSRARPPHHHPHGMICLGGEPRDGAAAPSRRYGGSPGAPQSSWASITLAAIAVLRFVGNVDCDAVRDDLADADWSWVALAFVAAQVPRVTHALASLGSIPADIRFSPLYVLQLATSFLNLALPSSLARKTVFILFLQRQGLTGAAAAVTASAIDSFAGKPAGSASSSSRSRSG